jgi:polyisoprenoid-binding protein YceI
MKKTVLGLACLMAASGAFAATETYQIDPRHTYPVFEVNHLGYSLQRGRFNKATGQIALDTAAKKGSVQLTIDVASLDMGLADWDKHMLSEDFFNVAKYPTITFQSDKLTFEGDKLVGADGNLTLLGVTRPVKLTVTGFNLGNHPMTKKAMGGANISTTIKRSDFGMAKMVPAVGDEVKIVVPVEAYKD